jgi:hypothetical protein
MVAGTVRTQTSQYLIDMFMALKKSEQHLVASLARRESNDTPEANISLVYGLEELGRVVLLLLWLRDDPHILQLKEKDFKRQLNDHKSKLKTLIECTDKAYKGELASLTLTAHLDLSASTPEVVSAVKQTIQQLGEVHSRKELPNFLHRLRMESVYSRHDQLDPALDDWLSSPLHNNFLKLITTLALSIPKTIGELLSSYLPLLNEQITSLVEAKSSTERSTAGDRLALTFQNMIPALTEVFLNYFRSEAAFDLLTAKEGEANKAIERFIGAGKKLDLKKLLLQAAELAAQRDLI